MDITTFREDLKGAIETKLWELVKGKYIDGNVIDCLTKRAYFYLVDEIADKGIEFLFNEKNKDTTDMYLEIK